MGRTLNPIPDPFRRSCPMSAETRKAVDALADPKLPWRITIDPEPSIVEAEDTDPDHFAYLLAPKCVSDWHRWRLLELAFRFWCDGGRNDEAQARAHSWAFRQDPVGVGRLWECVGRDVQTADSWSECSEKAPIWWLVHDAHPKTAQKIVGAFRSDPTPDVRTQINIGGVGCAPEVGKSEYFGWNYIAFLISDIKKEEISEERIKAEYSRVQRAEIAWRCDFGQKFATWRERREREMRELIARCR